MSHVIDVEILIDGSWVSICDDTLGRDRIRITRGRQDWASRVSHSLARMSLLNPDGRYSPRNPMSPYYGQLGRNTPLRVTVDGHTQFSGEVAEWPQRADPDIHVPLEAAGVLRRLSERGTQLRSVLRRTLLDRGELPAPVEYWPCEDGSQSTALWPALTSHRPMTIATGISLAASSALACSDPIPVLNDTRYYANVKPYGSAATVTALCVVRLDDDPLVANASQLLVINGAGGTGMYWRVLVNINRTLQFQMADEDVNIIATSSATSFTIAEAGALVSLRLTQSGANVSYALRVCNVGADTAEILTGSVLNRSFGMINRVTVGNTRNFGASAVGHVALYTADLPDQPLVDAVNGYLGETAGRRIERLCLEESVPLAVVGDLDETQTMGPQRSKTLTELLEEAADVDGGILYEPTRVENVLGEFEDGTRQGWTGGGVAPPTVGVSTVRAHSGTRALLALWAGGAAIQIVLSSQKGRFVVGTTYTTRAWLWVPAGDAAVTIVVSGVGFGPTTSVTGQWQELVYTWTCSATDNAVQFWAQAPTTVGDMVWIDDITAATDKPGLAYRTRKSLYNVDTTLTLDFGEGQVALPFEPVDDDQLLRSFGNSVTVTRTDGGSSTRVIETGPMSVQDPPNGVGLYAGSGSSFNLELDAHTALLAGWRAYLGTWNEQRFPKLSVNLRRHADLASDACAADLGHRITVVNPPSWLPPLTIEQQVQGTEIELDHNLWLVHYTCEPWRPFQVPTVGEARLDSVYSTLNAGIDEDDTSFVAVVETGRAMWIRSSQKPTLFPFMAVLCVDDLPGEEVSVTAIGNPVGQLQTFTVVRSLNGITRGWDAGTQVRVKDRRNVTW